LSVNSIASAIRFLAKAVMMGQRISGIPENLHELRGRSGAAIACLRLRSCPFTKG
jgi:hypothetical protein